MHTIRFPETRAVFNDLQVILSCNPDNSTKRHGDTWNPTVEEDIVRVRNLMNMIQELVLNKRLEEQYSSSSFLKQNPETKSSRRHHRYAAWMTRYGMLQTAFWAVSNRSSGRVSIEDIADTSFSGFAGRVAITPIDATLPSFRVIFDFTSHLNLSANISYQAIIPSDSEVFNIVASGQVKELIKAIENGTASLTDRDEQGRSLLNFAFHSARADMCKFLVDEKADVDAIEPARFVDSVGPIHGFLVELDSYIADEERSRIAECLKIMLEAGADTSIEKHFLDGTCFNVFMDAVRSRSVTTFKLILDFGEPFISINSMYNFGSGEESTALIRLAALSGYDDAHSVDIIDKAILLLQRGADISCCRKNGDTVLHTLLKCRRFHELLSKAQARSSWRYLEMWSLSFRAPKELLIVFITAGADVYATNDTGQTPTMLASIGRRDEEWTEALKFCGFDTEQVLAHSTRGLHHCSCQRQTSKLFFEEYCLHRKDNVRFEEASKLSFEEYCLQKKQNLQFEEIETDNEDGGSDGADEEIQKSGGGGYRYFQQCFERTELFDNGTEFCDANSESDQRTNLDVEEAGYSGGDEFTENVADHDSGTENLELTDFAFDLSVGNEEDDVEDFFDFGKYLNAFL